MGRRKKKQKVIIFCYYCDRVFDNEQVLILHQRSRHFKCPECHKKISSAQGMMEHVYQVHRETIEKVPHAKEGRDSFEVVIFGMAGVPAELIEQRRQKIYGEPAPKKQKVNQPGMMAVGPLGFQIPGTPSMAGMMGYRMPAPGIPMMPGQPMMMGYRAPMPMPMPMARAPMPMPMTRPMMPMPVPMGVAQQPAGAATHGAMPIAANTGAGAAQPGGQPAGQAAPNAATGLGAPTPGMPPQPNAGPPTGYNNGVHGQVPPAAAPPAQLRSHQPNTGMAGMVAPGMPGAGQGYSTTARVDHGAYGQPPMQDKRKKIIRIYEDEHISMEEKRAAHRKYASFVSSGISNLQGSIDARLASFA